MLKLKVLYFCLGVLLLAQCYCVFGQTYFWPLTPLEMFAQHDLNENSEKVFYYDKNSLEILPNSELLIPFGRFRNYFFQKRYFSQSNHNYLGLLDLQSERIKIFKKYSKKLDQVKFICFGNYSSDRRRCKTLEYN